MNLSKEELDREIEWAAGLVNKHFRDNEIPVLAHNDLHGGNMMMNLTDQSGERRRSKHLMRKGTF